MANEPPNDMIDRVGRVGRVVEYNTSEDDDVSLPAAIDAHQIRLHLCAHADHPPTEVNQAIRDALEHGHLAEQAGGYVVADEEFLLRKHS